MKNLIKRLLFKPSGPNKILSGVASGRWINYGPKDRTLHLFGLYETEIYGYISRAIKSVDTLIDIGANDGYYGVAFSKAKGKRIILCEPGPITVELEKNMQMNGMRLGKDYEMVTQLVSDKNSEREISINDLLAGKGRVFVLMDVDGVEEKILSGFNFSPASDVQWLIETHSIDLEKNIVAMFNKNGYQVKIIPNAWWRKFIPETRPLAHNRWLFASK